MDWKASAIAATLAGSVLVSTLTFTGTINLGDIKSKGFNWADKVGQAVQETKDMAAKFGLFKQDITELLNEKIAHINSLNEKIAQLNGQVTNGQGDLSAANDSIARLTEELEKANAEVQALKDEFGVKDEEVQTAFASMETAENMNTDLTLDTQNPDTVPASGPTGEPTPPPTSNHATEETAIKNAVANSGYPVDSVTVTDNTVTLTSSTLAAPSNYESAISSALGGKPVTYSSSAGSSHTYSY